MFSFELFTIDISAINTLLLLILLNIDSVISGEPVSSLVALSTFILIEIGLAFLSSFVDKTIQSSIKVQFVNVL
jgi:hypothetical protein